MTKTAIVYWSGTGNTAAMAHFVTEGAKSAGADVSVFTADEFSADKINDFDSLAFGCPSMGCEQLEESEFEPLFDSCKSSLKGKNVALFGSYGWGDGEWIRTWAEDAQAAGARLVADPVMANGAPDGDATDACNALGTALANA